jgi:NAD(P)H dehydrogenase (quinone)
MSGRRASFFILYMKVSVILAHPAPGSFNHAIAETVVRSLKQAAHTVCFHDLYQERFDPLMPAAEFSPTAVLPPEIQAHCDEILAADGIVIVHPNWWSQPPAILKGWVDRVLRSGQAYKFIVNANGEGKPVGLLKAHWALVINTANTPQDKEVAFLGDPQAVFWQKVVFGLCGVRDVHRLVFSPVITSTADQRKQWLELVAEATRAKV